MGSPEADQRSRQLVIDGKLLWPAANACAPRAVQRNVAVSPEALAKTKALPLAQPGAPVPASAPPGASPAPAPIAAPPAALPVPAWWNQARVPAHKLAAFVIF